MAIYTQQELDEMRAARMRISTGTNAVKVVLNGESTDYGPGNVALLNILIAAAEAQLAPESTDNGLWQPDSRKGF